MTREEQIKKAWESAFKNVIESIDVEWSREDVASGFFELGCRWADENRTDWHQVRIQAAIAAMQGLLSNEKQVHIKVSEAAYMSVLYADSLVKELKVE